MKHRPDKPPRKPGISSSSTAVTLVGADLNIEQAAKVIEQTLELNQNIPISGIQLIMAKSHVTVYFGSMIHHIQTSGALNINVGETMNVSAAAYDANNIIILGRPMTVVTSDATKVRINSSSGTSGAFNVNITGMAAGPATLTYTCDGVTATQVITCVAVPSSGLWLFQDNFAGGVKSNSQNGVSWSVVTDPSGPGVGSDVYIIADPGNSTGYALAFDFAQTTVNPRQDANIDQRFKLPDMFGCYVEIKVFCDAAYVRRMNSPNNHKLIRLWDQQYGASPPGAGNGSNVHIGSSTITTTGTGTTLRGQLIVEYQWSENSDSLMGNHGKGPYTTVFEPLRETTLGFYFQQESAKFASDGIIRAWVDGVQKTELTGIRTWIDSTYPGHANVFRNGHVMGTANYGFPARTIMYLRSFGVATAYPY